MTAPTLDAIVVGDEPEPWRDAGFHVDDDGTCRIGHVRVELVGRGPGKRILSWSLRDLATTDLDGLPTTASSREPCVPASHPNGAVAVDHVVVTSPDVARTVTTFERAGLAPLRTRDIGAEQYGFEAQQVFFRLGEVILELVGPRNRLDDSPARFFGLAHTVADIDAAARLLGPLLPNVKDAVQPGRRIATLRHKELDMSVATALMSPTPTASPD